MDELIRGTDLPDPFHAAVLYDSDDDLSARVLPFAREGLERGETVFAVVSARAEHALRPVLGGAGVRWQVPGVSYQHLGRMFEAVRSFLAVQRAAGRPTRFLFENDVDGTLGRGAAYLRFEAMSNIVCGPYGFPYACLYDRDRHSTELLDEVVRVHPLLLRSGGRATASPSYVDPDSYVAAHPGPLTPVPSGVALDMRLTGLGELPVLRRHIADVARALGMSASGCWDVELAAGEIIANAVEHGQRPWRVRVWRDGERVIVLVDDGGAPGAIATAGYRHPDLHGLSGRGLWIARQLADVVHTGGGEIGTGVELQFPLR